MLDTRTGLDHATVEDYIRRGREHLWIHTQQENELAQDDAYTVIDGGEGIYLSDIHGRRYIDAMSGLWVVAIGHGRRELAEVAKRQMEQMAYANPFAYATMPAVDLATKIAEVTPAGFTRTFFVNGGAEAVETALRMARQWQYNRGQQKRYKFISRIGSYHGMTLGALSVNNATALNKTPFEPLLPGTLKAPAVACNGCGETCLPGCETPAGLKYLEQLIISERPETIAAFITEPISTSNGSVVPSKQYWQTIRALCDKYGILLIVDEVINGFGRTGTWFAMEHFDVQADLMTIAKQISSGYAPIAAVVTTEKVAEGFRGGPQDAFIGGSTFGAHPVSCAVALANIEIMQREHLVENSAKVGTYLTTQLDELKSRHHIVSATRGIGLMQVIEMKKDPAAGVEFTPDDDLSHRVPRLLKENGILSRGGASIQVAPPLVINREEVDELVDGLDRTITALEAEIGL
ncbi:MAG: aspartate aminotransferase family protein [Chloroflexi bacterium HGW-Chloroflexi-9]|nr:MAG: aspartate aminotransferase family protein [Chloroflexi bacterium HGW-Chloroflexi-9]